MTVSGDALRTCATNSATVFAPCTVAVWLFGLLKKTNPAPLAAGLVFFNNPNNPTATVHGAKTVAEFVAQVRRASPDTVILIDEAYHDYVTDPSYHSAVPLALDTPNVFVTRTFSKAYGM